MENLPQNPEFRNNPENFHPCGYPNGTILIILKIHVAQMHRIKFQLNLNNRRRC